MEMYKAAIFERLRFQTKKGELTTEQLCTVSVEDLNELAMSLDEEYQKSGKKSYLIKKSEKDKKSKLKFDVVLDILNTKLEEAQALTEAKETKEHNEKIIKLIAEKKDESLKGKSITQLEAMLK